MSRKFGFPSILDDDPYDIGSSDDFYDTAQICLEGHVVNSALKTHPASNEKYCQICGKRTTTQCLSCGTDIRGGYSSRGIADTINSAPNHCHNCGKPFPWTKLRIKLLKELINESNLEESDKKILRSETKHIVYDTPRTTLARSKFKQILSKTNSEIQTLFKKLLLQIGTAKASEIIPDVPIG